MCSGSNQNKEGVPSLISQEYNRHQVCFLGGPKKKNLPPPSEKTASVSAMDFCLLLLIKDSGLKMLHTFIVG